MKLEAMKRQGSRTDLTLSQNETKSRSDEVLSKQVGESRAQVQRYIRLTELIPELLDLVDSKKRRSVIKRLHQKQIAIARRSGKPIPKYLDQEMERKRG